MDNYLIHAYQLMILTSIFNVTIITAFIGPLSYIIFLLVKRNIKHSPKLLAAFVLITFVVVFVVVLILFSFRINDLTKTAIKDAHQEYPEFNIKKITYQPYQWGMDQSYDESCNILLSKKTNPRIQFEIGFGAKDYDRNIVPSYPKLCDIYSTNHHMFDLTDEAKSELDQILLQESNNDVTSNRLLWIDILPLYYHPKLEAFEKVKEDMVINKLRKVNNYYKISNKIYYLDGDHWLLISIM